MIKIRKKRRPCKVEPHFLSERENHRLKVLFSSDGNRISHVSCVFEKAALPHPVESAVCCTLHKYKCPQTYLWESGWYRE